VVQLLRQKLVKSLEPRVLHVPKPPKAISDVDVRIAILFSGGLDCTVLARLAHDLVPLDQGLDLINVAFENPRQVAVTTKNGPLRGSDVYELCSDRLTGRKSFAELKSSCPGRHWRFIAVGRLSPAYSALKLKCRHRSTFRLKKQWLISLRSSH